MRPLPIRNNPLITPEASPSYKELLSRRRLGRTYLTATPGMIGTARMENSSLFEYAHLRASLPKDLTGSELFPLLDGGRYPDTYFLMRRSKDGYICASGMFRLAFPWATMEEQKAEREYVKSRVETSKDETAGNIWVSPMLALELAEEYHMLCWIRALLDPTEIIQYPRNAKPITPPPKFVVRVDPDFAEVIKGLPSGSELPEITNAFKSLLNKSSIPKDVIESKHSIVSYDGAEINVYRFIRVEATGEASTGPQPALIYAHGGGLNACNIDAVTRLVPAQLVSESGIQCFVVEYRMVPSFPYPIPLEDCYAALKWVSDHAEVLNVSPSRIGLIGESGGGCLVAGLSLLARDRGIPCPVKQILIQPMLDDRPSATAPANSYEPRSQYLSGYIQNSKNWWNAYLGGAKWESLDPEDQPYACPARAEELTCLPPTYIDVGSLDLSRDECLAFATKLASANVDVELHLYDGVPHYFDMIAPEIPITRNAKDNRLRAIRSI